MAYVGNNLSVISGTIEGSWNTLFYSGTDSLSAVLAANYISDGQKRGMEPGDIVWYFNGTSSFLLQVSAVQAAPNLGVTLSEVESTSASMQATKYTTSAVTTGSIAAGVITGANFSVWLQTGATPGAQLVRTAAQMLADIPGAQVGDSFMFRILNTGAGTLTLTTDAGATVTMSGTMTVATTTFRDFILTFNSATTATIQSIGLGTAP